MTQQQFQSADQLLEQITGSLISQFNAGFFTQRFSFLNHMASLDAFTNSECAAALTGWIADQGWGCTWGIEVDPATNTTYRVLTTFTRN